MLYHQERCNFEKNDNSFHNPSTRTHFMMGNFHIVLPKYSVKWF